MGNEKKQQQEQQQSSERQPEQQEEVIVLSYEMKRRIQKCNTLCRRVILHTAYRELLKTTCKRVMLVNQNMVIY
jgi:hypothetical protein